LSFDYDVLKMVEHHIGHGLVELYLVSFGGVDVDGDVCGEEDNVDEEEEEEFERQYVYRNDEFWDDVLSNDSNAFELDGDDHIKSENVEVRVDEEVGLKPEVDVDEDVRLEPEIGVDEDMGLEPKVGVGEDVGLGSRR